MTREGNNGQGGRRHGQGDLQNGREEDAKTARPDGRNEYIDKRPFRGGQKQGRPDPSRASNAERYSFNERPLE
jgi:hypothetical protein